ncbi:ATP-grasp domain-containing protein [Qipengyuania flava]|nr:ATP-grasp domain-containing protein [Qipengyuania flava]
MSQKILLAVEAMTLGVQRMNENAARHGYSLVLLAEDPTMYIDSAETTVVKFPTRDRNAVEAYIAEHGAKIGNVFSSTDTWGVVAAELREQFGFGSRIKFEKLAKMRDKGWVLQKLGDAYPTGGPTYPRILKPRSGTGSMDIALVADASEHRRVLEAQVDADFYISQPYYRGPLYSAEAWSDGRTTLFFGVTNRIMTSPAVFLERVKTFPHEHGTEWEAAVEAWIRPLLAQLDYDLGLAHIEFIETDDGFRLVELNARMAGALITPAIDHCTNYDPYALAIADALDIEAEPPAVREIVAGHSHVSIYANRTGTLTAVDGIDALSHYPGNVGWVSAKELGETITDLTSYKARIGNVHAVAPSPALAQDCAIAAAHAIKVRIE